MNGTLALDVLKHSSAILQQKVVICHSFANLLAEEKITKISLDRILDCEDFVL